MSIQPSAIVIEAHELIELAAEVQSQGFCNADEYPVEAVANAIGQWLQVELESIKTDVTWSLRKNKQTFAAFLPTEPDS